MKVTQRSAPSRLVFGACVAIFGLFILLGASSQRRDIALFGSAAGPADRGNGEQDVHRRELSSQVSLQSMSSDSSGDETAQGAGEGVLIVYLLYDSHKDMHQANFEYFRRFGILPEDGKTYLILGQALEGQTVESLSDNARFIQMEQQCAWGMLNELFISSTVDTQSFASIVVLSSFVRGPFLPPGIQASTLHWADILVGKLHQGARVVSPIISCEGVHGIGPNHIDGFHSFVPHLSWQAFAVDQTALQLLRGLDSVLTCYDEALVRNGAYQAALASLAVLQAGYNMDSLMLRYQGVDWRNAANWDCNERLSPILDHTYDGLNVHPLEVMFVPVDELSLKSTGVPATAAKRYDQWNAQQESGVMNVSTNRYALNPTPFRKERAAYMRERGPGCFDAVFYQKNSPDLAQIPQQELWDHFVSHGQFKGRLYRFSCLDMKARGPGCFDDVFYNTENLDLNDLRIAGHGFTPEQSWTHFMQHGRFEGRHYRFQSVCVEDPDSPIVL